MSKGRTHMSLLAMFKSAGPTGFGYEAFRCVALRGALVLGTARTKEKAAAACATLPGKAVGYSCELSDPSSVRECVTAVKADGHRLDAILCNAGGMMPSNLENSRLYQLQ